MFQTPDDRPPEDDDNFRRASRLLVIIASVALVVFGGHAQLESFSILNTQLISLAYPSIGYSLVVVVLVYAVIRYLAASNHYRASFNALETVFAASFRRLRLDAAWYDNREDGQDDHRRIRLSPISHSTRVTRLAEFTGWAAEQYGLTYRAAEAPTHVTFFRPNSQADDSQADGAPAVGMAMFQPRSTSVLRALGLRRLDVDFVVHDLTSPWASILSTRRAISTARFGLNHAHPHA